LLGGWGAQVVGSVTGDDIVARVHEIGQLPDLFLVDYRLGTAETGIELVQRLRQELDPEIPAILVTGSITPELDAQARAAALEFLLKPVTATALRERVAALLRINLA
jgi:CheY-like chemotaxis protein